MRPNTIYLLLLLSLVIVAVVTLSSEAMAQTSGNESNTSNTAKADAAKADAAKADAAKADAAKADAAKADAAKADAAKADAAKSSANQTGCALEPKKKNIVDWSYAVAGTIAGLVILVITFAASKIIRKGRRWLLDQGHLVPEPDCEGGKEGNYKGGFWDIIREGDYYPSLARLQFMIWTFTISFTLLSLYLFMLINHTLCWSTLPANSLALLGISAGVPIVSLAISKEKYMESIRGTLPCKKNVPGLSTMLLEHSKPTLGRYQMFLWTIISVIVYLGFFYAQISGLGDSTAELKTLTLPDIDTSLLFLMGLSQGTYLALKATSRSVSFLTIVSQSPSPNQKKIKTSTNISVSFSESLDSTTVSKLNFLVKKHTDGSDVPGTIKVLAEDDKKAEFDPTKDLDAGTAYDVTVLTGIQSKDKKKLENDETWSFETE